jgi:hypothetical protein
VKRKAEKDDLKFAQKFAASHTRAMIAYRFALRKEFGEENFHTLDQMATNAKIGLFEFVKARAKKLLRASRRRAK